MGVPVVIVSSLIAYSASISVNIYVERPTFGHLLVARSANDARVVTSSGIGRLEYSRTMTVGSRVRSALSFAGMSGRRG
jgi:hypothetical protein